MSSKSDNIEAQIISAIIGAIVLSAPAAIFAGAAPLLKGALGEWGASLAQLLLGAIILLFTIAAGHYYYFVLPGGKEPTGSLERRRYEALRDDLACGGTAARIYSEKLTAALKAVEHFFRDAGSPGQRVLGLKTPAPLWTAEAFHCCLLLALVYPLAMIFLIWAISGDVGPAEATLGLPVNMLPWRRVVTFVAFAASVVAYWRSQRTAGWRIMAWFLVCILAGSVVAINLAAGVPDIAGAIAVSGAVVGAVAGDIAVAVLAASLGTAAGAIALAIAGSVMATVAGFTTVAMVGTVSNAANISVTRDRKGGFWSLFLLVMIVCCLGAAALLSPLQSWPVVGPLLLFVGLLTLLNAPFLWFSLGLTRALLRRGLERQMWWPYFYALVDAACAVFVIALLAFTMVIGIQAFDFMAARSARNDILPLDQLFTGIAAQGWAPKYWWLYALFLSSMVPSLVNLAIGGLSLTRGIPRLSAYLHNLLNSSGVVSEFYRLQIALLLGSQVVVGVALGVVAQAILVLLILRYAMPTLGVGLLEMAKSIAGLHLPARMFELL